MKTLVKKTNGKKTETIGVIGVAFQLFMVFYPETISIETERAVNIVISSGVLTTLSHRVWRNREKIKNFIFGIFKNNSDE